MSLCCFISYRQEDTQWAATWLFDSLRQEFGTGSVFFDNGILRAGHQWKAELLSALRRADVMIALIGRQWLTLAGADGRRKLDSPKDVVRFEIATALERNIPIVPLLVNEALCPRRTEIPADIADMLNWQAMTLRNNRAKEDLRELLDYLNHVLPAVPPAECCRLEYLAGAVTLPPPLTLETVARAVEPSLAAVIWARLRAGETGFLQPNIFGQRGAVLADQVARSAAGDVQLHRGIERFLEAVETADKAGQPRGASMPLHETYAGRAYILLARALGRI